MMQMKIMLLVLQQQNNKKQTRSIWKTYRKFIKSFVSSEMLSNHWYRSRQTNTNIPQQINSTGNLSENDGATMFFIGAKEQKTILNFSLNSLIVSK